MKYALAFVALGVPLLFGEQDASPKPETKPLSKNVAARYSKEKLEKLRASLAAQIAVYDQTENAMRAPSPEEASALSGNRSDGQASATPLKGGGVAVRGGTAHLDFLVAKQSPDGAVAVSHGKKPESSKSEAANVR